MHKLRICFFSLVIAFCSTTYAENGVSVDYWKLSKAFYAIQKCYVDSLSEAKLAESAIRGMLKELDPHSVYIPAEEVERANESIVGNFDGIGISFQMIDDTLSVMQTIAGCPAEKVGVVAGDKIIAVSGKNIAGVKMPTSDISKMIRGPRGTDVSVKIVRQGVAKPIDFLITRDKIPIYSLDAAYLIAPQTAYIKLNSFAQNTMEEIYNACEEQHLWKCKNLILDLQGNGGGLLSTALYLADEFLEHQKLIVYTKGFQEPQKNDFATCQGHFEKANLIILVDESSASASEIVAGAIQDWDRGLIIGRRTFGKGLVQRPMILPDGSHIRLTVARYYTPSGRCIQKPYNKGDESYQKELIQRLQHGELGTSDSIKFPDSLRYETCSLHRTVYGGGGIMPDIFVPLDTTFYSDYYRDLLAKGVISKTIANYISKNSEELRQRYSDFEQFNQHFEVNDMLLNELIENGEKAGIHFNEAEFNTSKPFITLQIKAIIARDLWTTSCYYKIMNEFNVPLKKALELLSNPIKIIQFLQKKS